MEGAASSELVAERLETALHNNELPLSAQKTAFQLLNRLRSSTKIAVMGTNALEVTKLVNSLTGFRAIPADTPLPSVEIGFGEKEKTSFIIGENVVSTRDGLVFDQHLLDGVDLLRLETPNFRFRKISLVSCPLIGAHEDNANTLRTIQNRSDIALWCTHGFDVDEQTLWVEVKDSLKDNSYLVLTNAEDLVARTKLKEKLSQLEKVVSEEFFRMFVIGLNTAFSSLTADKETSDKIWKASGLEVLEKTLSKRVVSGQSADKDHTLLFLSKYGLNAETTAPESPKVEAVQQVDTANGEPISIRAALEILQTGAQDLLTTLCYIGAKASADILEHCLQMTNDAIDTLANSPDKSESANALARDLTEVSDMLILMQLERDENAAADAVTLLLQLKQGIELDQAA
jgi:hypothetical protein